MANIVAISEKRSNHWEIFVTGRREEPDGRPADYTRSSSAVTTNSRSRILLTILGGPIATGLKGLGTKYRGGSRGVAMVAFATPFSSFFFLPIHNDY